MSGRKRENNESIGKEDSVSRTRKRNVGQKYSKNEWFVYSSPSKKKTNCSDNENKKVTNNKNKRKKSVDKDAQKLDGEWRYSCWKPHKHRRFTSPEPCAEPAPCRELCSALALQIPGTGHRSSNPIRNQNEGASHHG